jgi:23S rRNA (uracil1939-C5)-methyltransferase
VDGLTGATCAPAAHPRTMELWGSPFVTDRVHGATLVRHARSFFQGNRFLLNPLVDHVLGEVRGASILDLYAGAGLFSVAAAASGTGRVTAVEGDPFSAADLKRNAAPHGIKVVTAAVETFVRQKAEKFETVIVDPPRTGMTKEATAGVTALLAPKLIYVSCDIATLARDARLLLDAGYRIDRVTSFDLFPNTAHVETVIALSR